MEIAVIVLVVVGLGMYYGIFGVAERVIKMGHKELDQLEKVHTVSVINRSAKMDKQLSTEMIAKAKSVNAKLKSLDVDLDEGEEVTPAA